MTAPLTERGTFALAGHEALVPGRYLDQANIPTIYIGHTDGAGDPPVASVGWDMPQTEAELDRAIRAAFDVFERDILKYARAVDRVFGPMKPHERDGWTQWHFNTGGAFTSSAVRHWKSGNKLKAVSIMKSWNKVTVRGQKIVSQGLVKRRKEEADLILRGKYPTRGVPVYYTGPDYRPRWTAVKVLDFAEVKRLAFNDDPEDFFTRLFAALGWSRWFKS